MSSEIKEEIIVKKARGRPKIDDVTKLKTYDRKKYGREFDRQYSNREKEGITENYKLEDIKPVYCDTKKHSAKPYRTFYIFVKKLLEKDSIQINADYKDTFLGFFTRPLEGTQSNKSNCVK